MQQPSSGDYVVRLRGLPWSASGKDIVQLLHDCKVANGESGVHFTFAPDGRASGEAFVELCSEDDVSKAISHNNEHMGKRYVEIFRASQGQMEWDCRLVNRDGGGGGGVGGGGGGSGGVVRLRGLPFRCAEDDVRKFFQGLEALCVGVHLFLYCHRVCMYLLDVCLFHLCVCAMCVGDVILTPFPPLFISVLSQVMCVYFNLLT